MSVRDILPHIIQPFRPRNPEKPVEPMCIGPLDVVQLMEFVERNSELRDRGFVPGALFKDAPVLTPERGFRY